MNFVIDRNIPFAREAFENFGDVTLVETTGINAAAVHDADVLIVRSETRVTQTLLEGSRVKFVGTATIGTDHLDLDYLQSRHIAYANAPGCNSTSVAQYMAAALLHLSSKCGFSLSGKCIGVVGVGNVGKKVVQIAQVLGMSVRQNDPPLARSTGDKNFVSLDDLMDCDVITLHVPLTKTGVDPTFHLFDRKRLASLKPGTVFVNTSRGAVVETDALKNALRRKHIAHAVVDVWENEPDIDPECVSLATIATSHIAGYSFEGKLNGVRMVRDAVCRHLHLSSPRDLLLHAGGEDQKIISKNDWKQPDEEAICRAVQQCYDIMADDRQLRQMLNLPPAQRGRYFMGLRSGYRIRREFEHFALQVPRERISLNEVLTGLGFTCSISN